MGHLISFQVAVLKNRQDRNLVLTCLDFKLLVNKKFAPPGVVTASKQNIFAVENIFVFVCVFVKDFAEVRGVVIVSSHAMYSEDEQRNLTTSSHQTMLPPTLGHHCRCVHRARRVSN